MIEYRRNIHQRLTLFKQGWVVVHHCAKLHEIIVSQLKNNISQRNIAMNLHYITL